MIIKATPTGRQFGDKIEPKEYEAKIAGIRIPVREYDAWEGSVPDNDPSGQITPQYWRMVDVAFPNLSRWP